MRLNHHNIKVVSLALLFLLISCSSQKYRGPSSNGEDSLSRIIDDIASTSKSHSQDLSLCKKEYEELYQRLFNLAGDDASLEMGDLKSLDEEIQSSFMARMALKEKMGTLEKNHDCLLGATDVFRGLRYVEDYLIEMRMEKAANAPAEYVDMQGEFPSLLVNPKYKDEFKSYEDLKSGDIILSRGNAFSSAAIARIGVSDYQFSHLSFVYKNPADNTLYTTEAHIEIGSVVAPLIDHVATKNARSVIYRFKDPTVADLASKAIFERVLKKQQTKKNIEYDFAMDFKNDDRLFCSEIISSGFKKVLPEEDYFPMNKSKFSPGIIPFLNTIGVPVTKENIGEKEVFAPGDIQFDSRFEMVAEWRNPRKMEESRLKDFILTKIFEKMEKEGYKFDPTFKMDAQSRAFWLLRRTPIVKKFLENRFPLNMKPEQLELFMALDLVGDAIYKEMEKTTLEYERAMTPKEIYLALDNFFKEDFETYKRYKKSPEAPKPVFHSVFHP